MRRSARTTLAGWSAVAGLALATAAAASTLDVPAEYPTITAALAAASAGDTVAVAPGTYVEDLQLVSGVTLLGTGTPDQVIVQGTGATSVIRGLALGAQTRLVSLTVRGGIGSDVGGTRVGGGIYVETSQLSLRDVQVVENQADLGGGLCAESANVTWIGGTLTSNQATLGGGLFVSKGSLSLSGVPAAGNRAGSGGALYVLDANLLTLDDCLWTGNEATSSGGAGYVDRTALSVSYCRFDGNRAGTSGGGFTMRAGTTAEFSRSIFYENTAGTVGGSWHARCDGLPGSACTEVRLSHCDILRNHAPLAGAGAVDGSAWAEIRESVVVANDSPLACTDLRGELRVLCSVVYANGGGPASGCPVYEEDVVATDPHLCNLDGGELERCTNSPLLVAPACGSGPYGALDAGCGGCDKTQATTTTWGRLKVRYR